MIDTQHHKTLAVEAVLKYVSRAPRTCNTLWRYSSRPAIGRPSCGRVDSTRTLSIISVATIAARDGRACTRILQIDQGRREPRPTIRDSSLAPTPERRRAPGLKPSHGIVICCDGPLSIESLPAAVQLGDVGGIDIHRPSRERGQLCHQFRHGHAAFFRALPEHCRSVIINFDGLGFHQRIYS